jgi:hypothetical protein
MKVLHVDHPDVVPGLTSPDGRHDERDDVSENCKRSKSVRPTQLHQPQDVRIIQLKNPNAAIAWLAPQTTAYH